MIALGLTLSLLIGISLGLLGGGGSILTLPVMLYVFDLAPKTAIATSLLVVGTTSLAALVPHARAHHVRWQTGMVFGAAGMASAYLGGLCAVFIPGNLLIVAFIAMMVATGLAMWRKPKDLDQSPTVHVPRSLVEFTVDGLAIGLVTGLVGVGGGFLIVPALVLLGGLSMPVAIGTSLMVIAMKSFAAFAGYASHVEINLGLACMVAAAAVCGSFVGARFVHSVSPEHLRRGFAVFVLVMALYMAIRELPAMPDGFAVDALPLVVIGAVFAAIAGALLLGTLVLGRLLLTERNRRRSGQAILKNEPV